MADRTREEALNHPAEGDIWERLIRGKLYYRKVGRVVGSDVLYWDGISRVCSVNVGMFRRWCLKADWIGGSNG